MIKSWKRILSLLLAAVMLISGMVFPASAATGSAITVADGVSLTLSKPYTNVISLKVHNDWTYSNETVNVYVVDSGTKITWPKGYTYLSEEWYMRDSDGVHYLDIGGVGFMPWLSDNPNAAVTFTVNQSQDILKLTTVSSAAWESGEDTTGIGSAYFILKSTYEDHYADKSKLLEKSGYFKFTPTFDGKNVVLTAQYGYEYNEAWFLKNPTIYNHDLAKMSIRVAMAAAQTTPDLIGSLFRELGYTSLESSYPAPTKDTIGYTIASKEIVDSNGNSHMLIAVAVRGGGYGAEWANNFLVGTGTEHKGFSDAADKVVKAVKDHMKELGTDKNFKIWITGYSRAAATSNLAAHQLNMDAKYNLSYLDESDIFAYCFECPSGVTGAEATFSQVADKNIFNIVNPVDLVPMVAPREWGFQRYGVTYYLPSGEINYKNYKAAFAAMKREYSKIASAAGASSKDLENALDFLKTQNAVLQNFIDVAARGINNSRSYTSLFQNQIVAAVNSLTNNYLDVGDVVVAVLGVSSFLKVPGVAQVGALILSMVDEISNAHYPELCLAWMDAVNEADMNKSAYTRYLKVNCPVNVSVYDSEGILVAQIIDDEVQEIEDGIGAMVDENGQKIVILPFDEEFRIVTTATDNGEMSYQVEEYDIAAAETLRVINYYDVEISTGDELTGTAGTSTEANAEYTLEAADGTELTATIEQVGDNVSTFYVQLDRDGNGEVLGGGTFVIGEYAKLTAIPGKDEQFLGWYCGEQLISMESEYRFRVERDMEILGKFTGEHSAVYRLAGADRIGTSLMLADQLKATLGVDKFSSVIVASALNFPDALTGSYLAAVKNAPILLTYDAAHAQIRSYIQENLTPGGDVFILGGESAVSASFTTGLSGFNVKRVAGTDRFGTNLAIMQEAGVTADQPVLIATALNFADSLSASAAGLPMVLVHGSLRPDQKEFLATTSKNFVIIGGEAAVSAELEAELKAIGTVDRLAGDGRYQTSVMVAQRFVPNPDAVVLAYARNFPDGLCGGPLAYALNAPLILTDNYDPSAADAYVDGITAGIVVGGTGLIGDTTTRDIFDLAAGTAIPAK